MVNKQQLIHLHALLAEVAEHVAEEQDVDVDISEYGALDVDPSDIHKPKSSHHEAVMTLSSCLSETVGAVEVPTATAGSDPE